HTPVRYKFMKSDKKEETDITTYIIRYILGYPEISFKYFVDGKLILQSYGGGLDEAVTQVYGGNVLPNCFKISAERNDIKISGFISNQNYFKSNKTYQNVYLNGRHIENAAISGAITNAYSGYTMKRQYPFYVLFITVPDEMVDVNVHPNKADVRFTNSSLVYGSIYKVISTILDGTVKAAEFVVSDDNSGTSGAKNAIRPVYAAEFVSDKVYDKDFSGVAGIEQFAKDKKKEAPKVDTANLPDYESFAPSAPNGNAETDLPLYKYYSRGENDKPDNTFTLHSDDEDPILKSVEADIARQKAEVKAEQKTIFVSQCKYRGTLFDTYLLYEMDGDVYIIDQHAAHERLIYDSLKEKLNARQLTRQDMLVPYILTVTPDERQFLDENTAVIGQMGFALEPFGENAYRVNSMPADLPWLKLKDFFDELLANIYELKNITLTDVLKDRIAQSACKHAVKGGEILTAQERDKLFEMLSGNMGLKCPHGRPVCVKLTKTEVEKMFKRKV
ncbi:MAG: DNA mismatch repair endonuclease MutL, partial [Clostridia bacterium]|nr:DNA mismatch repair endonuclease MutL [Clostridia bacterium]